MPCNEWFRLMLQYRRAAKAYGETVSSLGDWPSVQFTATWEEAERARQISDHIRSALLYHEHTHDCLRTNSEVPQKTWIPPQPRTVPGPLAGCLFYGKVTKNQKENRCRANPIG